MTVCKRRRKGIDKPNPYTLFEYFQMSSPAHIFSLLNVTFWGLCVRDSSTERAYDSDRHCAKRPSDICRPSRSSTSHAILSLCPIRHSFLMTANWEHHNFCPRGMIIAHLKKHCCDGDRNGSGLVSRKKCHQKRLHGRDHPDVHWGQAYRKMFHHSEFGWGCYRTVFPVKVPYHVICFDLQIDNEWVGHPVCWNKHHRCIAQDQCFFVGWSTLFLRTMHVTEDVPSLRVWVWVLPDYVSCQGPISCDLF
jgi:hypothetical protein